MEGSPEAVLDAIEEFGQAHQFLMNVCMHKGKIITDLISKEKPKTILEIGGYVGYSAILFGSALRKAGGQKYISIELNPEFASIARALVAIAALQDVVEVLDGPCRSTLRRLAKNDTIVQKWDLVFLDHAKLSYLNDLKLCEELGLVAQGSIVVADDMKRPGNPPYSQYVRASPSSKKEACAPFVGGMADDCVSLGNPSLVYRTVLLEGLEPTGQPVSAALIHY
jgi:catechol O-methyltransferase